MGSKTLCIPQISEAEFKFVLFSQISPKHLGL